jgi:hypothetical protein
MNYDLNYLMTSDFNEGLTPDTYKECLIKFRYEYRLLNGKNTSMSKELEKLTVEVENTRGLLLDKELNHKNRMSFLEEEIQILKALTNKKLSLMERITGKIKNG